MRVGRIAGRASALFYCLLMITACGPQPPVKLGFIASLTGRNSDLGEAGRNGMLLAVEEHNARGGIHGKQIEVLVRDDAGQADRAAALVKELSGLRVEALVGSFTSGTVEAMKPELEASRLLALSPTASSMSLHGKDDYVFRINRSTRDNARDYAEFMVRQRGWQRVAVLVDLPNQAFSRSWLKEFTQVLQEFKGQIVVEVPFDPSGDEAHARAARALLAAKVDCVLLITTTLDTARMVQQVRALDAKMPVLTSEWAGTEQLIEMGGRNVEGVHVIQAYNRDDPSPRFRSFREAYRARFHREPGYSSVMSYDATNVLIEALQRRSSHQSVKEAVLSHGPYQGLQQRIAFDRNGDTSRKVYFSVIRDGKFVLID